MAGRTESHDSRKVFVTAWALIRAGEKAPAVLYDNHHPKGHHRHIEGVEEAYEFVNVEGLIADFMADLSRVTGARE